MTWIFSAMVASLFPRHRERHERDHAGPLDGQRHLALVLGAVAADSARNDLAPVGDEVLQRLRILVVDGDGSVRAELADLAPRKGSLAACSRAALAAPTTFDVFGFELEVSV